MSPQPIPLPTLLASYDPHEPAVARALRLARALQEAAAARQTAAERRQQRELERMMENPHDKATLVAMTDQAFRSQRSQRVAEQLTHILDVQGVPRFFGVVERALLKGFQSFGSYLPGVAVPRVREKMRAETANVVLPAERDLLVRHLEARRQSGTRMNVNFLGEALLGEGEAERRLEKYLAALQLPELEVLSVKASTLCSQITALGRARAERVLCERLELLCRAAAKARYVRADGSEVAKTVFLDMEAYADLDLTLTVFQRTLERPGLEHTSAGIALQAYIPDSHEAQRRLVAWAEARRAGGAGPVHMRLVKGANWEMERVEASLAGWPMAPYERKADTDANYKRMLHLALDHLDAVTLGVASHNLFDLAYALVLAFDRKALAQVHLEMLEGMANHQRRALEDLDVDLLLYAPAADRAGFVNAIGYLVRRLDENSGPDNFLRHAFHLEPGSPDWDRLAADFEASVARRDEVPSGPRRTQDRRAEPAAPDPEGPFRNEPDTDFVLPQNRAWARDIVARWRARRGADAPVVPVVVCGEERRPTPDGADGRELRLRYDPSSTSAEREDGSAVVARICWASAADVDDAIACARRDPSGWRSASPARRRELLLDAAQELRRDRAELMGAALACGGKTLAESDPEVSEAVDFVERYTRAADDFRALPGVHAEGLGVVAVVAPWNFPIAIPCGGTAAALAAGNCVILKPSTDTALVALRLCECFWRAGVPREALQLLPCHGEAGSARLVASPEVDAVILTGGTETALRILQARPETHLLAETGGKNATIVTGMADREQAIAHVLHSAFSHAGQKCSATSLLILEAEVYDDPGFKEGLVDAVESLQVGSAWSLDTRVGPLVLPPSGALERGLKELEPGESWAVRPHADPENPNAFTPGVKWGVTPGSFTHLTELFGPVLAVMRADDLEHALDLANATGYGLTAGLESLDEREHALWRQRVRAGNLYINRVTTGAIVERQPFGGIGKSSFGQGLKAGGPNYVMPLMRFEEAGGAELLEAPAGADEGAVTCPEVEALRQRLVALHEAGGDELLDCATCARLLRAIASYERAFREEIGREHDPSQVIGQDNVRSYRPVEDVRVRVHRDDDAFSIIARVCAARIVGARVALSVSPDDWPPLLERLDAWTDEWGAALEVVEEDDAELAQAIAAGQADRVRYAAPERVPRAVLAAQAAGLGTYVARAPVIGEGRVELLWYVWEQSLSFDYHRYGNLGERAPK
jgi:RHH-type proline utilization regulon transcriptional repressor/proline dehydrogenase/delta 1-pyrroline-5-carboxylate dehydrogenase